MRRLAVLALLVACRPPSLPAVTDGATTGAATTADASGSSTTGCMHSGDCETDGICVAGFAPTTGELGGERGPAECVDMGACIAALDLGRWCFDHQSCCGDLRCRPADGICEPPDLGTSSSGGDTTTDTTATASTSSSSTGSSTSDTSSTGTSTSGSSTSGSSTSGSSTSGSSTTG